MQHRFSGTRKFQKNIHNKQSVAPLVIGPCEVSDRIQRQQFFVGLRQWWKDLAEFGTFLRVAVPKPVSLSGWRDLEIRGNLDSNSANRSEKTKRNRRTHRASKLFEIGILWHSVSLNVVQIDKLRDLSRDGGFVEIVFGGNVDDDVCICCHPFVQIPLPFKEIGLTPSSMMRIQMPSAIPRVVVEWTVRCHRVPFPT